jgi:hypothetical protein
VVVRAQALIVRYSRTRHGAQFKKKVRRVIVIEYLGSYYNFYDIPVFFFVHLLEKMMMVRQARCYFTFC